jgi:hypothetical protein
MKRRWWPACVATIALATVASRAQARAQESPSPPLLRPLPEPAASPELPSSDGAGPDAAEPATTPPSSSPPPPSMTASSAPAAPAAWATLQPGAAVTVRIRQVFPCDGLSPGERLLNGRPEIQPGDRFLAEVIHLPANPPPLVGGTVVKVEPPGRYGRAGRLKLQMTQLVEGHDGTWRPIPWQFETEDRESRTLKRRLGITALFALEGGVLGAGTASQVARRSPVFITGGLAAGVLVGLGYASFQRGIEAHLEQGDTFEIVVGTTRYRPISRTSLTTVYPAPNPSQRKAKHGGHP